MSGILPPTLKISSAYKNSLYQAGPVRTRINHYPSGIPKKLHHLTFILLSAYNPGGRLKPLGWNICMMKKLKQYLVKYEYYEGTGSLKNVSEPLLMIALDPRKAIFFARKFRQNAVVIIRNQRRSKLIFLT